MLELYTYFRSSASYRVRIALALKGLDFRTIPVHLVRQGGEQNAAEYLQINPEGLVPTLVDKDNDIQLTQSLAILEYLDEAYSPAILLPREAAGRARVRSLALQIACDIHPLNNLRVLQYLERQLGLDKQQRDSWYRHWIEVGFEALEHRLHSPLTGQFCHGDTPTAADCCLAPQVYNARRFKVDMSRFPSIERIDAACMQVPAFKAAAPEMQIDAPAGVVA